MRSLPGNPFDGHTLHEAIEQVSILTDQKPKAVFVDKGYAFLDLHAVMCGAGYNLRMILRALRLFCAEIYAGILEWFTVFQRLQSIRWV